MSDSSAVGAVIAVLGAFIVVAVVIGIVLYVFESLSLFTMAKRKGIGHAWFAWIPILSTFVQAEIIDSILPVGKDKAIPYVQWISLGLSIVTSIVSSMTNNWVSTVLGVLAVILTIMMMYRIYKLYAPDKTVLFLVLSIIFPVTIPFFLFAIRNNDPVEYYQGEIPKA